jgi:hypothetical protein
MICTCKRLIARMAFIVSLSAVCMYLGHVPPKIVQPAKQLVAWCALVPPFTVTIKRMHLYVMLHQIKPIIEWHIAQSAFSPANTFFCYFMCERPWTVLILIRNVYVVHLQTMLVCYTFCTVTNISGRFKAFRTIALQGISLKQIWIQNNFLHSLAGSWKKCLTLQQLMYGILSLCAPTVRKSPYLSQRISHIYNNSECCTHSSLEHKVKILCTFFSSSSVLAFFFLLEVFVSCCWMPWLWNKRTITDQTSYTTDATRHDINEIQVVRF